MASFIVMGKDSDNLQESSRFIRDGFTVFAFALPLIWLLWHRLWLHAAIFFAILSGCASLVAWSGNPIWLGLSALATSCFGLLVALEGGEWVRQSLKSDGYRELAVISARTANKAEELFASRMNSEINRKPIQNIAPALAASPIPLTGNL